MTTSNTRSLILIGAAVLTATAGFGQSEFQLHPHQLPGWDARTREGRCDVRVWVDHRAQIQMRGDSISVRTLEGSRGRDDGSQCTQAMPYNSVTGFSMRQTGGRNRVTLEQEPSRMNNYTATFSIDDPQGGGDNYAFEVTWQGEPAAVTSAPAPFFDDIRACQDTVRQRFVSINGRGSYVDFDNSAARHAENGDNDRRQNQYQRRNSGEEIIEGHGTARNWNESRPVSYSCSIDTRQNQVMSGNYQFTAESVRAEGRDNRKQLR